MKIEVCMSVHSFQRRFCWELSSILQQEGLPPGCQIQVRAAFAEGNGSPLTRDVITHFQDSGLDIVPVPYPDVSDFQHRGLVRNRHVRESTGDWILFTDADVLFPKDFFAVLHNVLSLDEHKDSQKCLHTGRFSTTLEPTEALVDTAPIRYPCVIDNAWGKASVLERHRMRDIGAGFCQIVNTHFIRDIRGFYIDEKPAPDGGRPILTQPWNTPSDSRFRRSVGSIPIPVPWMLHLQHFRDRGLKERTNMQR